MKYQIGNKIKGKKRKYGFGEIIENIILGEITDIENNDIGIKILEHENKSEIGTNHLCYDVKDNDFELIKE